jgi:hypothetical protein
MLLQRMFEQESFSIVLEVIISVFINESVLGSGNIFARV